MPVELGVEHEHGPAPDTECGGPLRAQMDRGQIATAEHGQVGIRLEVGLRIGDLLPIASEVDLEAGCLARQ